MKQQLTAREWIGLLPEPYKSQGLDNIDKWPYEPNRDCKDMTEAIKWGFVWGSTSQGLRYWAGIASIPPEFFPFPNKEREAAEALLKEFKGWFDYNFNAPTPIIENIDISDFLNQKYPS